MEDEQSEIKDNLLELLSLIWKNSDMIFLLLMSKRMLSQIFNDVKKARIYSVVMNEIEDIKRHGQISSAFRYGDSNCKVHEILGFYRT